MIEGPLWYLLHVSLSPTQRQLHSTELKLACLLCSARLLAECLSLGALEPPTDRASGPL